MLVSCKIYILADSFLFMDLKIKPVFQQLFTESLSCVGIRKNINKANITPHLKKLRNFSKISKGFIGHYQKEKMFSHFYTTGVQLIGLNFGHLELFLYPPFPLFFHMKWVIFLSVDIFILLISTLLTTS